MHPSPDSTRVVTRTMTPVPNWHLSGHWPAAIARWEPQLMAAAAHYWIDTDVLAAVMLVESGGNPNAVSSAGAIGLMQIMPFHACVTYDPAGNIDCGASILAVAIQRHGGQLRPALAEYYAGPTGAAAGRGYHYADLVLATLARSTDSYAVLA